MAGLSVLISVSLTGCGGTFVEPEPPSRAQALWSARTPYTGDNSRVAALVREVGPAPDAGSSISLQTANPPYVLTIHVKRLDKPFGLTDFSGQATLLLGLIGNLDRVSVTSRRDSYSMTAASASRELGYDVKELGRDRAKLTAYLDASRD